MSSPFLTVNQENSSAFSIKASWDLIRAFIVLLNLLFLNRYLAQNLKKNMHGKNHILHKVSCNTIVSTFNTLELSPFNFSPHNQTIKMATVPDWSRNMTVFALWQQL